MLSIIITFYNENNFVEKTIDSIYEHTQLPFEIILVDDCSTDVVVSENLLKYPSIRFFKNDERKGLIWSRILGTTLANSPYLVFMDAHCNPQFNWDIELIKAVQHFGERVICVPIIPKLDPDRWVNSLSEIGFSMTFNERLEMKWCCSNNINDLYVESPIYAGCISLIPRSFYFELQGLDGGLQIWGAENIDLSLRCWMFGGKVVVVTSSIVGHMFKSINNYRDINEIIISNKLRIAFINFSFDRFERILKSFGLPKQNIDFRLRLNPLTEARQAYLLHKRIYDDDWYMNKFNLSI